MSKSKGVWCYRFCRKCMREPDATGLIAEFLADIEKWLDDDIPDTYGDPGIQYMMNLREKWEERKK